MVRIRWISHIPLSVWFSAIHLQFWLLTLGKPLYHYPSEISGKIFHSEYHIYNPACSMENRRRKTSLEAIANSYHKGRFKKLLVVLSRYLGPAVSVEIGHRSFPCRPRPYHKAVVTVTIQSWDTTSCGSKRLFKRPISHPGVPSNNSNLIGRPWHD